MSMSQCEEASGWKVLSVWRRSSWDGSADGGSSCQQVEQDDDLEYICDPCWQNESEVAQTNFELQSKEVKNVSFGRIWGFHKNEFIKPSSSDPNAPNSN